MYLGFGGFWAIIPCLLHLIQSGDGSIVTTLLQFNPENGHSSRWVLRLCMSYGESGFGGADFYGSEVFL